MSFGRKTPNPGWKSGKHWAECDVCGFIYRHAELRRRWDGVYVCEYDYEPRHPQDLIRGVRDDTSAKGIISTESVDSFISVTYTFSTTSRAGIALSGLARAGSEKYSPDELSANTIPPGTGFNNGT